VVNPGGSQDAHGELLRAKRGVEPEEDVSDRDKPLSSRGAVEAVSILGAPRKPTCEWRRRDFGGDEASEAKSCRERDSDRGSGVEKTPATRREGEINLLVAARPAEAGPARRETTDPSIAPLARADQAGRKPRARVQVRKVVDGRSRSDTS